MRHERTAAPSIMTVQQPQTPCSQPTWVPVAPSEWRRKSLSSMRGSASAETLRPLSVSPILALVADSRGASLRLRDHDGREAAQDIAPHAGRGMQVLVALELPGEPLRSHPSTPPLPAMRRTTGVPAMPPTPSRTASWPSIDGRDRDDGEIAVPARHLAERRRRLTMHREAHGGDQFIRLARGGQHVALEFAAPPACGCPVGRAQHHLAFQQRKRQRHFRPRIGMRDRAANRALVAGLEVADERQRRSQQRKLLRQARARPSAGSASPRRRPRPCRRASRIASSSAMRVMSTSTAGSTSRRLSIASSDCPPASTRASSPCSASTATASSTVSGTHIVERTRLHRRRLARPGRLASGLPSAHECGAASPAAARP